MLAGTLQHVDELVVRIEVVQPAGCQQASQVTSIPGASSVQLNVSDQAAVKVLRSYRSCKSDRSRLLANISFQIRGVS